jgi:hypothetical protein
MTTEGAAIAAVAGAILSYFLNTFPALRSALDSVPSLYKAYVVFSILAALAAGAVALQCYGLFDSGVVCPATVPDGIKLAFYVAIAFGGSQLAHGVGQGASLGNYTKYNSQKPKSVG